MSLKRNSLHHRVCWKSLAMESSSAKRETISLYHTYLSPTFAGVCVIWQVSVLYILSPYLFSALQFLLFHAQTQQCLVLVYENYVLRSIETFSGGGHVLSPSLYVLSLSGCLFLKP
jgi:hypothetical protein